LDQAYLGHFVRFLEDPCIQRFSFQECLFPSLSHSMTYFRVFPFTLGLFSPLSTLWISLWDFHTRTSSRAYFSSTAFPFGPPQVPPFIHINFEDVLFFLLGSGQRRVSIWVSILQLSGPPSFAPRELMSFFQLSFPF